MPSRRLTAMLAAAAPSLASEGALGRSISGAQVTPYIGVIPPTPGLNVWTYPSAAGHTHLFQRGTLELNALAGVDIHSKNKTFDVKHRIEGEPMMLNVSISL